MRSLLYILLCTFSFLPSLVKAEDGKERKPLSFTERRSYDLLFLEATTERLKDTCDAEAYELYEAASRINPAAADPYFWMGMIKLDHKQHSDTLVQGEIDTLFARAVALDTANREFRKMQALNFAITGRLTEAIAAYEKLPHLELDGEALEKLFDLYYRTKNYDGAIDCLNKLEAMNGGNEQMSITKYQLYQQKGDKEGMYRTVLSIDAEDLGARVLLIDLLCRQEKHEEVQELCREGRIYHPEELIFGYYEGITLLVLKREAEAVAVLQHAIKHKKEDCDPELLGYLYKYTGNALHEIGRKEEAYMAYDSSFVYLPGDLLTLNNYAYFLAQDSIRLDEAEQMSRRTIEEDSLNATYLDTYAWVLYRLARYEEALAVITKAEECFSTEDDPDLRVTIFEHRAEILLKLGKRKEAKKYKKLAAKLKLNDKSRSDVIPNSQ